MVLNSFLSHVFEAAVVKPLCPLANRFCGCLVWARAPFFDCVSGFLLFILLFPLAKRKSGWGICGSSWFGGLVCFLFF